MTVLLFLLFFGFYTYGASGTIPVYRDSGDLIASSYTLGIAHPPGYPVYVVTAKLFQQWVPFGNPSYQMNLLSAFWGALALVFLFRWFARSSRLGALVAVGLFGLSPAFVMLARVSEMYTLTVLVGILFMWGVQAKKTSSYLLSAFLLGMGFGVQPTLIFLAPALVGAVLESPSLPDRKTLFLTLVFLFFIGMSVVLMLPIRAHTDPLLNWGNPSSWRQFWRVMTRADYGGLKLHPVQSTWQWTPLGIFQQVQFFVQTLAGEWGWAALLIVGGGISYRARQLLSRPFAWGLFVSFLLLGPLFFLLSNLPLNEPTTPAILQPYLLLPGIFVAFAIVQAFKRVAEKQTVVSWGMVGMLALLAPRAGWTFDGRQDFLAYDYGRNLLRSLPPNAVLYDPDDPTSFTVRALQMTEGRRMDIIPLNFFHTRWGYDHIRRHTDLLSSLPIENGQDLERVLWSYSRQRHPFYAELPQKLDPHPYASEGLVYAAYPVDPALSRLRAETNFQIIVRRDFSQTVHYADFFARHLVSYYAAAHCNLGLDEAKAQRYDRAAFHYRYALTIDPLLSVAYNNWGNLEFFQKHYLQAIALYKAGLRIDPHDAGLQSNLDLAETRITNPA